jgi:NAD(P)-dependent dehydrogenase (short-subunit alcohol dehydrogenase family)
MIDFKGKVIVITGAGAGLGLEYAKYFASKGANLVLNDLAKNESGYLIEKVCKEIQGVYGCKAVAVTCSVIDGEKIIKAALDNFGRIDVLINNAGIIRDKSLIKMTEEDWDLVV